jgi:hypothetical protein
MRARVCGCVRARVLESGQQASLQQQWEVCQACSARSIAVNTARSSSVTLTERARCNNGNGCATDDAGRATARMHARECMRTDGAVRFAHRVAQNPHRIADELYPLRCLRATARHRTLVAFLLRATARGMKGRSGEVQIPLACHAGVPRVKYRALRKLRGNSHAHRRPLHARTRTRTPTRFADALAYFHERPHMQA